MSHRVVNVSEKHYKPFSIINFAGVITKRKLIKVSLQVVLADRVICSINRTFAVVAPKRFNGIRIGSINRIDSVTVVNNAVVINLSDWVVTFPIVHIKRYIALDVCNNMTGELLPRRILDLIADNFQTTAIRVTLQHSHYWLFIYVRTTTCVSYLTFAMTILILTTYKRLVKFYLTIKFLANVLESATYLMKHIPSSLLSDLNILGKLY